MLEGGDLKFTTDTIDSPETGTFSTPSFPAGEKLPTPSEKDTTPEKKESHETIRITEKEFYLQHYQAIADRRNTPSFKKLLFSEESGVPHKVTAEEVEAEFEKLKQEDLERRKSPEYQEWARRRKIVIDHFKAKKNDPEGEGKKYRIAIFGCGGGMRGRAGGAQAAGFNEVGLTAEYVDWLGGISAGIADLVYYAGGKLHTLRGLSIYYTQCATKAFINLTRFLHVLKATVVGDAMTEGPVAVDQEALRKGRPKIFAGIVPRNDPTAPVEFADIMTARPNMIAPVVASMNVPILFAPGIEVNTGGLNIQYQDGAFGQLPIEEIIELSQCTDVIILPQCSFQTIKNFKRSGKWVEKLLPRSGSLGTVRKFIQVADELRKMLDYFKEEKNVDVAMMWPPDRGGTTLNNDPDLSQIEIYDTIKDTIEQCEEELPKVIEMYLQTEGKYLQIVRE